MTRIDELNVRSASYSLVTSNRQIDTQTHQWIYPEEDF
jgi:hypothetical protein